MTQLIADQNDILFVLQKQFDLAEYAKLVSLWEDFGKNKRVINMTLQAARNLALKEILESNEIGDDVGAKWDSAGVTLPVEFHDNWGLMTEGGWIAMTEDLSLGGSGMPNLLAVACSEYFTGANFAFMMYPGLARFVGRLIERYVDLTKEENDRFKQYVKGLYTGKYCGTMCLTEPQAGSDVGAVETTAVKNENGTYTITGNKIFITNGEHALTDNIIHTVLARIEGSPTGTKGISMFIVPKIVEDYEGEIWFNNVKCTGIEEKMGIHGNSTCSLSFEGSTGFLVGEPNKGMSIMFSLMNEARHMVALQGVASASAAYLYALDYARTRIQGRALKDIFDHNADPVAIINHPDVRRMLMDMKSYVEGMRGLVYYIAYCEDMVVANDGSKAAVYQGLIDLLTPLAKGFCTEKAVDVVNTAMQVHGGAGYMKEYPIEQLLRDVRITPIYEGTTGIQAMDFMLRQVNKGDSFTNLTVMINKTIQEVSTKSEAFRELGSILDYALKSFKQAKETLMKTLENTGNLEAVALQATPMMFAFGHIVCAWQLLWKASIAGEGSGKFLTCEHYMYNQITAEARGLITAASLVDTAAIEMKDKDFGG